MDIYSLTLIGIINEEAAPIEAAETLKACFKVFAI